jgi:hypothetical protein
MKQNRRKADRRWPTYVGWGFLTGAAMVAAFQLGNEPYQRYVNKKSPYVQIAEPVSLKVPSYIVIKNPKPDKAYVSQQTPKRAAEAIPPKKAQINLEELVTEDVLSASKRVANWRPISYFFEKGTPIKASTYLINLSKQISDVELITKHYGSIWGAGEQEKCTILAKLYRESKLYHFAVSPSRAKTIAQVFPNHLETTSNLIKYLNESRGKNYEKVSFQMEDLLNNPHKAIHSAVISNLVNADAYGMPASLAIYVDGEGAFTKRLGEIGVMPRDYHKWKYQMKDLQAKEYVPEILKNADEIKRIGFKNFVFGRELSNIAGAYKNYAISLYIPGKDPKKSLDTFAKLSTMFKHLPNKHSWENEDTYLSTMMLNGRALPDSYTAKK